MSQTERYARLEALFAELVELEAEERSARLARLAPADEELRGELLELLLADAPGQAFLEPPPSAAIESKLPRTADSMRAPQSTPSVEELAADMRLGSYRIAKKLAEGGMGSVYLASRADREFEQLVAIKLSKRGLSSEAVHARLRLERQTLAGLSHPYIARLLDGGSTPEGRPYLVLEYIEGKAIDAWCEERRLDFAARVQLLIRVGEAVAHAHRRLVVHRDLKPSNILVTEDGSPRLLDFGIAKLLSLGDAGSDPSILAFTPAYASPEQMRGETVSTATDIFSLGRILERLVLPELRGVRRREVAAIVARATAAEEERRYPSVESLLEELQRLLDGLPVQVLAASKAYVLRRFLARHRLESALVAAVIAAMIGTSFALALANQREQRERERAEAARQIAEQARGDAQEAERKARASEAEARRSAQRHLAALDFLQRLFHSPTSRERGPEVRMVEVLDDARRQLELLPPEDPISELAVRRNLGGAYAALGRFEDAVLQLERSVDLARREFGEEDRQCVLALGDLGEALLFTPSAARGQELLERAATAMRARESEFATPELLAVLHAQMRGYQQQRQWIAGLAIAEEALHWIQEKRIPSPQASDLLTTASALELNRDASSERGLDWLREAIALAEERFGVDHELTQDYRLGLAIHMEERGLYEEARQLLEPILASRRARFPRQHPNLRLPLTHLGIALRELGKHEEALRLLREALLIQLEYGGEDHRDTSLFRNNLAVALRRAGQIEEAEKLLRQVVATEERRFGRSSLEWALARNNLAVLLHGKGAHREAQEILSSSLEIVRVVDSDQSLRLAQLWLSLGRTHSSLQEHAEAERCYARAEELRKALLTPGHPWTVEALHLRGQAAAQHGAREDAVRYLREALELLRLQEPPRFEQRFVTALDLAAICGELERWEEAREVLEALWAQGAAANVDRNARAQILDALVENAERRGAAEDAARWKAERRALGEPKSAGG
ncbi:MAG: serine/threonine protein kinase [Planctomycetes bacterium]|nr:serine/threonine protein kinase [Planctomycetota bacterium]